MRTDILNLYRKLDKEELIKQIEREEDKQLYLALGLFVAFVLGLALG
jgi:hypothetical protein